MYHACGQMVLGMDGCVDVCGWMNGSMDLEMDELTLEFMGA